MDESGTRGSQDDFEKEMEGKDKVFFNYDIQNFEMESIESLDAQAVWLLENSDVTIIIEGHCDERGTR